MQEDLAMRSKLIGLTLATVTAVVLLGAAVFSTAGEKKGDKEPKRPDLATEAVAAQQISSAYTLAEYGRKHKAPEALLMAAIVLAEYPTPKQQDGGLSIKEGKAVAFNREKEADALIAEAEKMGVGDDLKGLLKKAKAAVAEAPRSPVGGARTFNGFFVDISNTGDTFNVRCNGGQYTTARVTCLPQDNNCDLDLKVFDDQNNQLVAQDTGPSMDAQVTWFSNDTRLYRIRVINFRHTQGIQSRCRYTLVVF